MKRYAQEQALLDRRAKEWRSYSFSADSSVEPGRFRKRKPLDCGRSRCGLCHGEKRFDRPSHAQKRADEAARFAVREWQEGISH